MITLISANENWLVILVKNSRNDFGLNLSLPSYQPNRKRSHKVMSWTEREASSNVFSTLKDLCTKHRWERVKNSIGTIQKSSLATDQFLWTMSTFRTTLKSRSRDCLITAWMAFVVYKCFRLLIREGYITWVKRLVVLEVASSDLPLLEVIPLNLRLYSSEF